MLNQSEVFLLKATLIKFRLNYWKSPNDRPSISEVLNYASAILNFKSWNKLVESATTQSQNKNITSKILQIAKHMSLTLDKKAQDTFLCCSDFTILELGKTPPTFYLEEICNIISKHIDKTELFFKKSYLSEENYKKDHLLKEAKKNINLIFKPDLFKKHFIKTPRLYKKKISFCSTELIPKVSFMEKINSIDNTALKLTLDMVYHCLIEDWKTKKSTTNGYEIDDNLPIYKEACDLLIGILNKDKINSKYMAANIINQKSIHKPTRFSEIIEVERGKLIAYELEKNIPFMHSNFHLDLPHERLYLRKPISGLYTGEFESLDRFSSENGTIAAIEEISRFSLKFNCSFELMFDKMALSKNKIRKLIWPQNVNFAFGRKNRDRNILMINRPSYSKNFNKSNFVFLDQFTSSKLASTLNETS